MKEVFEGFIQPVENLLQNLGVHILVDRKCCLKFGQLCGLIKPVCPVQFSLIETVIVQLPANIESAGQSIFLLAVWF
jgi:hypothetical protein